MLYKMNADTSNVTKLYTFVNYIYFLILTYILLLCDIFLQYFDTLAPMTGYASNL